MEKRDESELIPPQVLAEKFKSKQDLYKLLVTEVAILWIHGASIDDSRELIKGLVVIVHLWIDFKLFSNGWLIHSVFNRAFVLINVDARQSIELHLLFSCIVNTYEMTRINCFIYSVDEIIVNYLPWFYFFGFITSI